MEEETIPSNKTGRSVSWIILGMAVIVLAGAAFLAGRLLNPRNGNHKSGGLSYVSSGPGGETMPIRVNPSRELPHENATNSGIFQHREDNSIFIGTGNIIIALSMNESDSSGEDPDIKADFDGPVIEVVAHRDTLIFHDVTYIPMVVTGGKTEFDQELEPGSVDEIAPYSLVTVWGEEQGDRIMADVIVYKTSP